MNFDPKTFISNVTTWPFLQEPIWRWAVFILAIGAIASVQKGMLRHMKAKL